MKSRLAKYFFPHISKGDIITIIKYSLLGGFLAGCYGIVHDQVTYLISTEYYTKLKFRQFFYADFGLGDRILASTVGFIATWWAGVIIAWLLARRVIPNQNKADARVQILQGFVIVFVTTLFAGVIGYCYGLWRGPDADYSLWEPMFKRYAVTDKWAFVRVAYIHNAGYAGGFFGLILSLSWLRRRLARGRVNHG